jgi:hypothetical protein
MIGKSLIGDGQVAYINTRVEDDPDEMPGEEQRPCAGCAKATWVNLSSLAEAERRGEPVIVCMPCAGAE